MRVSFFQLVDDDPKIGVIGNYATLEDALYEMSKTEFVTMLTKLYHPYGNGLYKVSIFEVSFGSTWGASKKKILTRIWELTTNQETDENEYVMTEKRYK